MDRVSMNQQALKDLFQIMMKLFQTSPMRLLKLVKADQVIKDKGKNILCLLCLNLKIDIVNFATSWCGRWELKHCEWFSAMGFICK